MIVQDLDRDGRVDVAGVERLAHRLVIAWNAAAPVFSVDTIPVPEPRALTVGDMTGDGRADLAVLSKEASIAKIMIFAGDGGSFVSLASYEVDPTTNALASGDLDVDGRDDLVITGDALILLLSSDGFATPRSYAADCPSGIAIADFDGDHMPDVAVGSGCNGLLSVFHNSGGGALAAPGAFAGGWTEWLIAADLDRDGWCDLVGANGYSSSVTVFWNDGTGVFGRREDHEAGDWVSSLAVGDLDGDGLEDLVAATSNNHHLAWVRPLHQRPDHTFAATVSYFMPASYSTTRSVVAVADVDGWGGKDVIVGVVGADWRWRRGDLVIARHLRGRAVDGMVDHARPWRGVLRAQILNLEGAERPVVMVDDGIEACLMRPLEDGTLGEAETFPEGVGARVLDLDADGRSDLLTQRADTTIIRLCGIDGRPGPPKDYVGDVFLTSGEFNGDGLPDLVLLGAEDTLTLRMNRGGGTFGPAMRTNVSAAAYPWRPRLVATGDLDGDGHSELLVGRRWVVPEDGVIGDIPPPDSVRVLRSEDGWSFVETGVYPIATCHWDDHCYPHLKEIVCADLDRDGDDDVVTHSHIGYAQGFASVLRNEGGGVLGAAHRYVTPSENPLFLVRDINGDHAPDLIAVGNVDGGELRVNLNLGHGVFDLDPGSMPFPDYTNSIAVADLNRDGAMDLVAAHGGDYYEAGVVVAFGRRDRVPVQTGIVQVEAAGSALSIRPRGPHPITGPLVASVVRDPSRPARVELLDVGGRRILHRAIAPMERGDAVRLTEARALPPGIYWLALNQEGRSTGTKIVVLR